MVSALALILCAPAAMEAHGLADLARLESRLPLVLVAAAPIVTEPGTADAAAGDTADPGGGAEPETTVASGTEAPDPPEALTLETRLLTGEALARLVRSSLAEAAAGRVTIGVSGLFAETRGGQLHRLWAAGAPTGPSRVHRVGVDTRLLAGAWAPLLQDPALPPPPYDPAFVPPELIAPPAAIPAATLASRRAAMEESGWMPACPRAGPLA